jgi:hypothetical protein
VPPPQDAEKRCPICGVGVLQELGTQSGEQMQRPESRIVETYTCGHEVPEATLATADADRLEVERRSSEDTAATEEPGRQ